MNTALTTGRLSAEPNIEETLQRFLDEKTASLAPATQRRYRSVIQLFIMSMNDYGPQYLNAGERRVFARFYEARGHEHRELCQVFGPEKIPQNTGDFFYWFMPRNVMPGKDLNRVAQTVVRKLATWLRDQGYIDNEMAGAMIDASRGG